MGLVGVEATAAAAARFEAPRSWTGSPGTVTSWTTSTLVDDTAGEVCVGSASSGDCGDSVRVDNSATTSKFKKKSVNRVEFSQLLESSHSKLL